MGDLPDARTLPTQDNTNIEQIETSVLRVGFELKIKVLERARTLHAVDRAATVMRF
jgi:hypothetical protein